MHWRLLFHPQLAGTRQMAIDEALYRSVHPGSAPVLRFYTWAAPTLSLGYFQNYKRVVCESFCVHNKINVVRRITGGRSVLHHMEVTYSVVAPHAGVFENCNLQECYRFIAGALNLGLKTLGIQTASIHAVRSAPVAAGAGQPQCFVSLSRYELGSGERKTIGSAQKRGHHGFLQHGSILLDFDAHLQAGCVNRPDTEIEKKIAPIRKLLSRDIGTMEVVEAFHHAFSSQFGVAIEPSALTSSENRLVDELEVKYQSEDWNRSKCR